MVKSFNADQLANGRLLSLDVMRGMIMILLCGESCMLYESLKHADPGAFGGLINQFFIIPGMAYGFGILFSPLLCLWLEQRCISRIAVSLKKGKAGVPI